MSAWMFGQNNRAKILWLILFVRGVPPTELGVMSTRCQFDMLSGHTAVLPGDSDEHTLLYLELRAFPILGQLHDLGQGTMSAS